MGPGITDLSTEGAVEMLSQALGKMFRRGFDIGPVRSCADSHDPFQGIVPQSPFLLIVDETEDLNLMVFPVGPLNR